MVIPLCCSMLRWSYLWGFGLWSRFMSTIVVGTFIGIFKNHKVVLVTTYWPRIVSIADSSGPRPFVRDWRWASWSVMISYNLKQSFKVDWLLGFSPTKGFWTLLEEPDKSGSLSLIEWSRPLGILLGDRQANKGGLHDIFISGFWWDVR